VSWFDAPPLLLPDLIERQGRRQGAKTALICGGERLSWREFAAAVERVANALAASGVQPGDAVLILMRNSVAMAEAMFGVMRAGGVVVPLNVSVPDDAVAGMLADCGATAVIASDEHCARFHGFTHGRSQVRAWIAANAPIRPALEVAGPPWQEYLAWRTAAPIARSRVMIAPDSPCNIIYSSGTTALPKGIVHTHRRRFDWAQDLALALRYDSRAVTLCTLGLYSNISWVGLLCTFLVGGIVVIEPGFDVARTFEVIARERVTHMSLVPLQFQRLLEAADFAAHDLGSLRSLMCCGSPLPLAIKRRALREFACDFIELYGLTEGVITTLDPEDAADRLSSVGKPLPGTELRIIGEDDREVACGEAGEIVGRGRIVMAGYHQREDANAEATWIDDEGRRWLRTGDIGRLDAEGFLYLVDRRKDMIISGGQNVYPADIEAVMITHPQVAEVAVIGIASEQWGESPFAVIVPRPGAAFDVEALMRWTNERVGRQQRIVGIALRESLPRNPNGKILKRELRRLYPMRGSPA
jgi:acyl-CoA synthetase (AMP-forming)/AMP-acid ligase II